MLGDSHAQGFHKSFIRVGMTDMLRKLSINPQQTLRTLLPFARFASIAARIGGYGHEERLIPHGPDLLTPPYSLALLG